MDTTLEQILRWFNTPLFYIGQSPLTLGGIGMALLILFASFPASAVFQKMVTGPLIKKLNLGAGPAYALNRIVYYMFLLFGAVLAMECIGLNLGSLTVLFGFLGVGIGFGLQNITSNFISGLILLLERPIAVGDFISIEGQVGTVTEVRMRATIINTLDNVSIIIPNSKLIENHVINWSHRDPRVCLHCPVGVAYGSDVEKVREALLVVAEEHPAVLKNPKPQVTLESFGDSALHFGLGVWLARPEDRSRIQSEINFAIEHKFREMDIEIPFPKRDIYLQPTEALDKIALKLGRFNQ